jgi:hypothetical protein
MGEMIFPSPDASSTCGGLQHDNFHPHLSSSPLKGEENIGKRANAIRPYILAAHLRNGGINPAKIYIV